MNAQASDFKERLIHRDISWLNFNERVLEEAVDPQNPLLEQARFLAIFSNNLDEFFMVRIAGLKRLLDSGFNKKDAFGYYPQDLHDEANIKIKALIERLYDVHKTKIKTLEKHKIFFKKYEELTPQQSKYVKKYFDTTIFPIITPMAVDEGHPFPVLPSKTIAFAVSISRGETPHLAIIPIPKVIGRLLRLPSEKDEYNFILVDEIIRANINSFFRGYKLMGNALFRVIRDSELSVDEGYAEDLLKAIENELKKRPKAKIVYLEIEHTCSPELIEALCLGLDFPKENITKINGELGISYLFELPPQVSRPELCYQSLVASKLNYENIFDKIKEADMVLHLPYQSFDPTVDLIQSAAKDPGVLAIKMTLYRTDEDSLIVKALKEAAKNKKQVTVLVEIKARFDEEKNINWAKELEYAGCHVIYGFAGMKIHSKIALVVRKEEEGIRRYVHLSSGNYNEKTARVYTDVGYFTVNEDFARDISDVFNVITGYSLPSRWKRIISAPYDLRAYFFELIDKEIEFQKKFKNGLIIAKMNSLEDVQMIEKLYEASSAGVKIKLIVRGMCCLMPGVPGMSETIEVKSVVGRFLEHSRIFLFNNNTNHRIFLASSDWMTRNFDRRIELLFEVEKEDLKEHLRFILDKYLDDNLKSWTLDQRQYTKQKPAPTQDKFSAQNYFLQYYTR